MSTGAENKKTVFVVDDDPSVLDATSMLLDSLGINCETYASGEECLNSVTNDRAGCLVLDIKMPGMGGLELQATLKQRGNTLPIIFITGYGDVPMAVEAMQNGALDFIQKPFDDQELLDRIDKAFRLDEENRTELEQVTEINERLGKLTHRERDVFDLVVKGMPNKIIASELDISQRTVEIHRARVMEKMQAKSVADLVRMKLTI